jgi:hypothetical protein
MAADAEIIVAEFIENLGLAIETANRESMSETIPQLLPARRLLKLAEKRPLLAANSSTLQWSLLYNTSLREHDGYGSSYLPVQNASFRFDVSFEARITSFHWQWRPIEKKILSKTMPFAARDDHEHDEEEEHSEAPGKVFFLRGENTIQTHLAPYYVVAAGHHAQVTPASYHSLQLGIAKSISGGEITLMAAIEGGSGRFHYNWAKWIAWEDDSFEDLGTAASCRQDPGAFQVSLLVEDLDTGVRAQKQEFIYFSGERQELSAGSEREALPNTALSV